MSSSLNYIEKYNIKINVQFTKSEFGSTMTSQKKNNSTNMKNKT